MTTGAEHRALESQLGADGGCPYCGADVPDSKVPAHIARAHNDAQTTLGGGFDGDD